MSEPVVQPPLKMADRAGNGREVVPSDGPSPSPNAQVHLSPNQKAWRRFKKNRPAVISAWFLLGLLILVIAWPVFLQVMSYAGPKAHAFAAQYDPNSLSDDSF